MQGEARGDGGEARSARAETQCRVRRRRGGHEARAVRVADEEELEARGLVRGCFGEHRPSGRDDLAARFATV